MLKTTILLASIVLICVASGTALHGKTSLIKKTYKWVKVPKYELKNFGVIDKVKEVRDKKLAWLTSFMPKKEIIHKETIVYPAWKIHKYKGYEIKPIQYVHNDKAKTPHATEYNVPATTYRPTHKIYKEENKIHSIPVHPSAGNEIYFQPEQPKHKIYYEIQNPEKFHHEIHDSGHHQTQQELSHNTHLTDVHYEINHTPVTHQNNHKEYIPEAHYSPEKFHHEISVSPHYPTHQEENLHTQITDVQYKINHTPVTHQNIHKEYIPEAHYEVQSPEKYHHEIQASSNYETPQEVNHDTQLTDVHYEIKQTPVTYENILKEYIPASNYEVQSSHKEYFPEAHYEVQSPEKYHHEIQASSNYETPQEVNHDTQLTDVHYEINQPSVAYESIPAHLEIVHQSEWQAPAWTPIRIADNKPASIKSVKKKEVGHNNTSSKKFLAKLKDIHHAKQSWVKKLGSKSHEKITSKVYGHGAHDQAEHGSQQITEIEYHESVPQIDAGYLPVLAPAPLPTLPLPAFPIHQTITTNVVEHHNVHTQVKEPEVYESYPPYAEKQHPVSSYGDKIEYDSSYEQSEIRPVYEEVQESDPIVEKSIRETSEPAITTSVRPTSATQQQSSSDITTEIQHFQNEDIKDIIDIRLSNEAQNGTLPTVIAQ